MFVLDRDVIRNLLSFEKDWGENIVIVLKEGVELLEIGHTEGDCFTEMFVSKYNVFFLLHSRVKQVELVV